MLDRLRQGLTFANMVSVLALFIALGGASYAAFKMPKNSVGEKQLKNGAVTAKKVRTDSLTGNQINESTLETVPTATLAANAGHADSASNAIFAEAARDSSTLQGNPPSAFIHGSGEVISRRLDLEATGASVPLVELPGIGKMNTECDALPADSVNLENKTGDFLDLAYVFEGKTETYPLPKGGSITFTASTSEKRVWEIQAATRASTPILATIQLAQDFNGVPNTCGVFVQAILSR